MPTFIHDDFLLHTRTARRLYHEYSKPEPILDYHCHLPVDHVGSMTGRGVAIFVQMARFIGWDGTKGRTRLTEGNAGASIC